MMGTRAAQESEGRVGNAAVNRRPQTAGRVRRRTDRLRRTAPLFAFLALVAVLGGCEFFTASAFPEYVSSISASQSVSAWYDGDRGEVFMTAAADIVENRLFFSVPDGPAGERMLVFDRNLELEENWTLSEINGEIGGTGSLGRRGGFGPGFVRPFVGSFIFESSGGDLTPVIDTTSIGGLMADPFAEVTGRPDPTPADVRFYAFAVDNNVDPTELIIEYYDTAFAFQAVESGSYPIDGSDDEYRLLEVIPIYEDTVTDSSFLFLFGNLNRDRVYWVDVPYSQLPTSNPPFPGISFGILDGTYDFNEVKNVDAGRGFITADGLLLVDDGDDALVLRSFDDEEIGRYDLGNAGDLEFAVPLLDGDGFYMLDRRRERLYRISNFWD